MANPETPFEIELLNAVKKSDIIKAQKLLNSTEICKTKLTDGRYFDYHLVVKVLSSRVPNIQLAELFIEKGFRVYKESEGEKTILEYAVRSNNVNLIKTVLAKGGSLDILTPNKHNLAPFHVAINKIQLSIIDLFLTHFDDAKILDERNLIHYAIEKQNTEVIVKLVKKGCSLAKRNEQNLTAFCVGFNISGNIRRPEIIDCLLSHFIMEDINLDNSDDIAPAYIACISGNLELVKKYVDSGLSINNPLKWNTEAWSCLRYYFGFTLLHCAVKHMKLGIIEFLLSAGADVCIPNENGSTSLHIAFETKEKGIWVTWKEFEMNNSIIDLLLKANMNSKSNPINDNGLSHFHIACSRDESTIAELFLKLGASIDQPVTSECHLYKEYSPLHFAAKFRCVKTLELLLKNGADVKQRDFKNRTPLHIAAKESCPNGVSLLLQYGADITSMDADNNSPLHLAFEEKNYEIIDVLLTAHYKNHENPVNAEGVSHFHIACTRSNVDVVKSFVANGVSVDTCVPILSNKELNASDWSGYSPLHFAVSHNRAKNVQLLLQSGANVGMKSRKGYTPLHVVCQYNYTMFREFIKNTLCDMSKNGEIVLQQKPMTDIVKVSSIEKYSHGFRGTVGKIEWTLHRAEHLEIMESLLSFKSDVNSTDNDGNTPLFHACATVTKLNCESDDNLQCLKSLWNKISKDLFEELSERSKAIFNILFSAKVDLGKSYKNGSILHYMCSRDDDWAVKMMKVFLEKGTDINVTNDKMLTPLYQAVSIDNKKMIRTLLDFDANVNCINPENDSTPLMIAVLKENPYSRCTIVKRLLNKGANVNAINYYGRTALHNLASRADVYSPDDVASQSDIDRSIEIETMTSVLMKAGANVNSKDAKGCTPLHVAYWKGTYLMAHQLLIHGADINAEDNDGESVCCDLYKILLGNQPLSRKQSLMAIVLENHIIKMNAVGLPMSEKVLRFHVKNQESPLQTDKHKRKWMNKCEDEVRVLQDTKITNHSTLYNALFKDENTLSQMVKNRIFKSTVQSTSFKTEFPVYGTLIQLKYQEGVDRGKLLPIATRLLNNLAGEQLPDACTEHICKYFTNFELKECTETLSCFLDFNAKRPNDNNATVGTGRANKRQKVR